MHIKQLALTRHYHGFAVFPDCLASRLNSSGHEISHIVTQLFQFALKTNADFIKGTTRIILIDEIRRLHQFSLAVGSVGKKNAVLNIAFRRNDDEQNTFLR